MTCPIPHDEAQRLAVLHELRWLDSGPEPVFDALTRLASTLLDVPIAVVSLVDTSRQWFKSRVGLDAAETTREAAFCAHAIMGTDTFVVGDARDDQRFADNPLVTGDPHIRAYAGVPLTSIDGHALGTLCAIDREPRQFSDRELDILRDLASIARHQIVSLEQQRRAETLASRTVVAADDGARLMHAMVEHAGIGIAMVGLDGAWLRVNPKMAEILGRTREDLMSRTFQEITHPDDLDEDMDLVQQLLAGTFTSYALEKRYLKPDGSIVWGNLTVSLVRDAQGSPAYFVSLVEDISQRQAAEEALRQLRRQLEERVAERTADLQAVLAHAHDAYICIDEAGVVVEWNRQAEATFGWKRHEALGGHLDTLIIPPAFRERHRQGIHRAAVAGRARVLNHRFELPAMRRDGSEFACELSITELHSQSRGRFFAAFLQDISARKQAEREIAESHEALKQLNHEQHLMLDNDLIGIAKLKQRTIVWNNLALERMLGFEPEELVGQPSRVLYADPEAHEQLGREAYPVLQAGGTYRMQIELVRRGGERIWVDVSGAMLSAEREESLWMLQDISAMKRHQQRVEGLAFHDALTGLPNRPLLLDRIQQAIATARRSDRQVAVCFADLNGFKAVNDQHGHDAGDELLRVVAARLQECARASDTVARLGGDEFVLLLTALEQEDDAAAVVHRVEASLERPVTLSSGASVRISSSFGIALGPRDGDDPATLIAAADAAMYLRKRQRRARDAGFVDSSHCPASVI